MSHMTYEASKKLALRLIILLAIITIVEVFISLLGKGHISENIHFPTMAISLIMIAFSLVKAYYIVGEFMHLKHEAPGMAKTIIIPFVLLIWGVIAFMADGTSWLDNKKEMSTDAAVYELRELEAQKIKHEKHTKGHGHDSHDGHGH